MKKIIQFTVMITTLLIPVSVKAQSMSGFTTIPDFIELYNQNETAKAMNLFDDTNSAKSKGELDLAREVFGTVEVLDEKITEQEIQQSCQTPEDCFAIQLMTKYFRDERNPAAYINYKVKYNNGATGYMRFFFASNKEFKISNKKIVCAEFIVPKANNSENFSQFIEHAEKARAAYK